MILAWASPFKHHGMVLKWQDLLVYCHDIKYHAIAY